MAFCPIGSSMSVRDTRIHSYYFFAYEQLAYLTAAPAPMVKGEGGPMGHTTRSDMLSGKTKPV